MPFDPELLELMTDTVTWEPSTGQDAYGRRTYGAPVVLEHCRIQYRMEMILGMTGQDVLKAATVYVAGSISSASAPVIGLNDRITLPDGSRPKILNAGVMRDEHGPHHTVIHLGLAGGAP